MHITTNSDRNHGLLEGELDTIKQCSFIFISFLVTVISERYIKYEILNMSLTTPISRYS